MKKIILLALLLSFSGNAAADLFKPFKPTEYNPADFGKSYYKKPSNGDIKIINNQYRYLYTGGNWYSQTNDEYPDTDYNAIGGSNSYDAGYDEGYNDALNGY